MFEKTTSTILAISWGNQIELIPLVFSEELDKKNLLVKAHFIGEFEIIYMKWISYNMIIYVDSRKIIRTI